MLDNRRFVRKSTLTHSPPPRLSILPSLCSPVLYVNLFALIQFLLFHTYMTHSNLSRALSLLSFFLFIFINLPYHVALGKNFIVKNTSTNMIHTNNTTAMVIKLVPQDFE